MADDDRTNQVQEIFRFQIHRRMTNQARKCLNILEDLLLSCHFDYKAARKTILDELGENLREIDGMLDLVDFSKKKK